MVSASPTTAGIAREHRDRSGEAFKPFTGGMATFSGMSSGCWEAIGWSERRSRDAGHPQTESHGHEP